MIDKQSPITIKEILLLNKTTILVLRREELFLENDAVEKRYCAIGLVFFM